MRPNAGHNAEPFAAAGPDYPPGYVDYVALFNQQRFFEAHDALEPFWLTRRGCPEADFFKALIQLAGAFVHFQKDRLRPAVALLNLACANLQKYPARHRGLDVAHLLGTCGRWSQAVQAGDYRRNPLHAWPAPCLTLDLQAPAVTP